MRKPATITIVNGMRGGSRVIVRLLAFDADYVWVEVLGEHRRFSRLTGFEHPPGGTWSTWRLSGKDHRQWRPAAVAVPPAPRSRRQTGKT